MSDLQDIAEKGAKPAMPRLSQEDRLTRLEAKVDQLIAVMMTAETTIKAIAASMKYPKP